MTRARSETPPTTPTPEPAPSPDEAPPAIAPHAERYRRHREQRSLDVPLTQHEFVEKGRELAAALHEIHVAEADLAQMRLDAKGVIERHEGRATDLARTRRAGSEVREIEVEITLDFVLGTAFYARLDSGEIYSERPLTYAERQLEIKLA